MADRRGIQNRRDTIFWSAKVSSHSRSHRNFKLREQHCGCLQCCFALGKISSPSLGDAVKRNKHKNLAFMALAAMYSGVAYHAERDQVLFGIGSRMAAKLSVVHLKI